MASPMGLSATQFTASTRRLGLPRVHFAGFVRQKQAIIVASLCRQRNEEYGQWQVSELGPAYPSWAVTGQNRLEAQESFTAINSLSWSQPTVAGRAFRFFTHISSDVQREHRLPSPPSSSGSPFPPPTYSPARSPPCFSLFPPLPSIFFYSSSSPLIDKLHILQIKLLLYRN